MAETPLQMATRHVAEQEALIAKHWALIRQLQAAGHPDALALEILAIMQRTLEVFRADLDRLSQSGRRRVQRWLHVR